MSEKELVEKWKEILATAEDGDPQHSFSLFKGLIQEREQQIENYKQVSNLQKRQ